MALKEKWQKLKNQKSTLTHKENFDAHTAIVADIISPIAHVGDISQLILDPDLDSYYLTLDAASSF